MRARHSARVSSPMTRCRVRTSVGIRVRADAAADHVVRVAHVGDPVADRLVGGVLERAGPAVDGHDRGPEQAHAVDVERLAAHVLAAHVHGAAEPGACARGRGGHAVLPGAGLGDDAPLAHALRRAAPGRARC